MFSISTMKVGTRLGFGYGLVLLLLVGITLLGATRLSALNDNTQLIVHDRYAKVALFQEVVAEVNLVARTTRNIVLFNDPDEIRKGLSSIATSHAKDKELIEKVERTLNTEKGKELFKSLAVTRGKYLAEQAVFERLASEGKKEEATAQLLAKVRPLQLEYMDTLQSLVTLGGKLMDKAAQDADDAYHSALNVILTLTGLAVALAVGIGFWTTRSITGPLNEAVGVAQKVAAGDLTSVITVKSSDETGMLLQALKDMNASLASIVSEVRGGTDSITSASGQIAAGNADLSQRTEEQASSLEETASSMEELTSTVKQNADNARQANQLAAGASAIAVKGGAVVGQVVGTMSSINDSSKKIVDIISVIDGIAFQTNILALNAAVEAARAGEQGRGFAVVASEVRSLAQRSAAAAKEIKGLITDSVGKVQDGTRLVGEAGKTMDEIVTSVKRVTDIMAEIAAASQEQSSGIEQVNQAVMQMDEVTQQNAALVEEAAAAAESLQEQAHALTQAVSVFKLAHTEARVAVQAPATERTATVAPLKRRKPAQARQPVQADPRHKSRKVVNAKGGEPEWQEF